MALSYSAINSYGRVTLPSVEAWGTNMSILKDPPKSIYTRKIDKVGQDSSITSMVDDAGDRVNEAIKVFARGVNPCVSVSYNNIGNNGGQGMAGSLTGLNNNLSMSNVQARLPYPVMKDGDFRPPLRAPQDEQALSRRSRAWTSQYTAPGFADFTRKLRCATDAEHTREVKTHTIKGNVRPTAYYKINTPAEKPFEVKYVIQPTVNTSASSGVRTLDYSTQNVSVPTHGLVNDTNNISASANFSNESAGVGMGVDAGNLDMSRYMQERDFGSGSTNLRAVGGSVSAIDDVVDLSYLPTRDIHTTSHTAALSGDGNGTVDPMGDMSNIPIQDFIHSNVAAPFSHSGNGTVDPMGDMSNMPLQEAFHLDVAAPISQEGDGTKYIHDPLELERVLPMHYAVTNHGDSRNHVRVSHDKEIELERNVPVHGWQAQYATGHGPDDMNSSREAKLIPKISPGGFSGSIGKPLLDRMGTIPNHETYGTERSSMSRSINHGIQGRFNI